MTKRLPENRGAAEGPAPLFSGFSKLFRDLLMNKLRTGQPEGGRLACAFFYERNSDDRYFKKDGSMPGRSPKIGVRSRLAFYFPAPPSSIVIY